MPRSDSASAGGTPPRRWISQWGPRRRPSDGSGRWRRSNLTLLTDLARGLSAYADLLATVREGKDRPVVAGGAGALPGLLLATLSEDLGLPLAVVVADDE